MDPERPIHILGIPGSLRRRSYNRALLVAAQTMVPPHTTLDIADLAPLPFYNADVEAEGTPASVLAFREQIRAADALLIATPEYNYSITGVLKNALDWASRGRPDPSPLRDKPAALIGAGGRYGTVRSQGHLRDILLHDNVHVLNQSLMVPLAGQHFDDALVLTHDDTRARLIRLLVALRDWTVRLHPTPA